jgi:phosphinothricin acetyltransferase
MIRNAFPADIASIAGIYNEAIAEGGYTGDLAPVSVESRAAWYREHDGRHAVFVMEIDGEVVGYVALSPYRKGRQAFGGTGEISYYVAGAHRGSGFGRQLIEHAMRYAGRAGFEVIVAMVLGCNPRSIELLKAAGFQEVGRLPGAARIGGGSVDHVYLSRKVTTDPVDAAVRAAFPAADATAIAALLDAYGTRPRERERERVQLAIVKLCDGDAGKLRHFIDIARIDYREVLAWAGGPAPTPGEAARDLAATRDILARWGKE